MSAAVDPEILENLVVLSADKLDGGSNFFLQQDLTPAPAAKNINIFFKE